MDEEIWRQIPEFPDYAVSSHGRVRNVVAQRNMALNRNQHRTVYVGLMRDSRQYKRSVAVLVAEAFVEQPAPSYDTPINLDGNRDNNFASNILWRPRWFAVRYHMQFQNDGLSFIVPIEDVNTGERFANSREAAVKYGLLERDIVLATQNKTFVFPTYQVFQVVTD